ncbi:MAG TPA: hypothetical protein VLO11_10505, partial [Luteolibacter sp.]|nr:hypothetical protein [Luteolibacter sp.]
KAAAGGYVSGAAGSAAGVRTNQGTGAAAWDTKYGQGGVAKTKNDHVYAAHNGNGCKKDADGNWSSNTGSGWKPAEPAQPKTGAQSQPQRPSTQPQRPTTQPQATSRQSLDSMARSRERGSVQTQRTQSFQRSTPSGGARSGGGGGTRSGGGGSRRR